MNVRSLEFKQYRCRETGSMSVEFNISFAIFMLMVFFPLVNLMGFTCGAATCYLMAIQTASRGATSSTFAGSLDAVETEANKFLASGLASFGSLKPVGGYNGTGTTVYIERVNCLDKSISVYGPNVKAEGPIDKENCIYEYETIVQLSVKPLLDLSALPGMSGVPTWVAYQHR